MREDVGGSETRKSLQTGGGGGQWLLASPEGKGAQEIYYCGRKTQKATTSFRKMKWFDGMS